MGVLLLHLYSFFFNQTLYWIPLNQSYRDFFSLNSWWISHSIFSLSKSSKAYPYVQLNAAISNSQGKRKIVWITRLKDKMQGQLFWVWNSGEFEITEFESASSNLYVVSISEENHFTIIYSVNDVATLQTRTRINDSDYAHFALLM